jgi:hypothetical protein
LRVTCGNAKQAKGGDRACAHHSRAVWQTNSSIHVRTSFAHNLFSMIGSSLVAQ